MYKALQQRPFIALVGPSGSGKSSVVRAGLCPKLRQERLAPWEIATLVPGGRPFHHLAGVLSPLLLVASDRHRPVAKLLLSSLYTSG